MGGPDMAPNSPHPALVTPRGTRGAPRLCVPCGPPLNSPVRLDSRVGRQHAAGHEGSHGAEVAPIDATLGAVVTNLDLARMDALTWKTVEQAFHDHAVLVFPGQNLSAEAQVAFANRFGDIELLAPDPEQKAVAISNQKPDGSVMGRGRASLQIVARQ